MAASTATPNPSISNPSTTLVTSSSSAPLMTRVNSPTVRKRMGSATNLSTGPIVQLTMPMTTEMNYFGRLSPEALWKGLPTLVWSIPHIAWRMFGEATTWGLQWWFVALTLFCFPRRALRPAQLFLLLTILGDLAALLLAGMIAPVAFEEHIGGFSHRFLMQLAPAGLLFAFAQLHDEFDSKSTSERAA